MKESNPNEPLLSNKTMSVQSQSQYAPSSESLGFFHQTALLTKKNLLITFINPKNILFLLITPFILSLFLFGMQHLAVDSGNRLIPDPGTSPLLGFSKCGWNGCTSL